MEFEVFVVGAPEPAGTDSGATAAEPIQVLLRFVNDIQAARAQLSGNPAPLTFASAAELAGALRRAADAHGLHEAEIGHPDPDWPQWYADFLDREQHGQGHDHHSEAGE